MLKISVDCIDLYKYNIVDVEKNKGYYSGHNVFCCTSCHENEDEGFERLLEFYFKTSELLVTFRMCCGFWDTFIGDGKTEHFMELFGEKYHGGLLWWIPIVWIAMQKEKEE